MYRLARYAPTTTDSVITQIQNAFEYTHASVRTPQERVAATAAAATADAIRCDGDEL